MPTSDPLPPPTPLQYLKNVTTMRLCFLVGGDLVYRRRATPCPSLILLTNRKAGDAEVIRDFVDDLRAECGIGQERDSQGQVNEDPDVLRGVLDEWWPTTVPVSFRVPDLKRRADNYLPMSLSIFASRAPMRLQIHIASNQGNGCFVTWDKIIRPT